MIVVTTVISIYVATGFESIMVGTSLTVHINQSISHRALSLSFFFTDILVLKNSENIDIVFNSNYNYYFTINTTYFFTFIITVRLWQDLVGTFTNFGKRKTTLSIIAEKGA